LIIGGAALQVRQCLSEQLAWLLKPSFNSTSLGLLLTSDSTSTPFPSLLFLLGVEGVPAVGAGEEIPSSCPDIVMQIGALEVTQESRITNWIVSSVIIGSLRISQSCDERKCFAQSNFSGVVSTRVTKLN
jgi:hypothetical protein